MCDCNKPDRILTVNAKCSDLASFNLAGEEHDGYVPPNLGVGAGDYVMFKVCLDCGKIQDTFPKKGTLHPDPDDPCCRVECEKCGAAFSEGETRNVEGMTFCEHCLE